MLFNKNNLNTKGFTLVELIVVLAIISILATISLIALNPIEMLKKGRDSRRLTDMESIKKAFDIYISSTNSLVLGPEDTLYASAPVANALTGNADKEAGDVRMMGRVDGSGWVPVNFSSVSSGSPIPTLPVDPGGDFSSITPYYYRYMNDGTNWEINAKLESSDNASKMQNDGGNSSGWFEIGSKLDIIGD